jgi:hypothetical protein
MSQQFSAIKPLRTIPILLTRQRGDDWVAVLKDEPLVWASGSTEAEAIGCLLLSHAPQFRVLLQRESDDSSQARHRECLE